MGAKLIYKNWLIEENPDQEFNGRMRYLYQHEDYDRRNPKDNRRFSASTLKEAMADIRRMEHEPDT